MSTYKGELNITSGIQLPADACVVIVRTVWNALIVDKLTSGCASIFDRYKVAHQIISVPGAFEIPFAIKNYWETKRGIKQPHAFVALGCVLKGDTPHFDYVCKGVTDGIMQLNLTLPVPTIFGVLTLNSEQQADERTGGIHGNKGEEAALTTIKMIALQHV